MDNMRVLKVAEMDRYLDFWNLMVSLPDIVGGWCVADNLGLRRELHRDRGICSSQGRGLIR